VHRCVPFSLGDVFPLFQGSRGTSVWLGCLLVSAEGDTGARYTDIALRLIGYEVANAAWVTTLATLHGWVTMDKWPAFT
jgi:hypothetical protein